MGVVRHAGMALGAVLICTLAGRAFARPPRGPRFVHAHELLAEIDARLEEARRKEEFEAKPRVERMVLLLERGEETFEGEALTGERVVEALFAWDALEELVPPPAVDRALAALPRALGKRYGFIYTKSRDLRRERYEASRLLVDTLTSESFALRSLAIESLEAMYGRDLGYRPEAPESERRSAQRRWLRSIRKWR